MIIYYNIISHFKIVKSIKEKIKYYFKSTDKQFKNTLKLKLTSFYIKTKSLNAVMW